MDKNCIDSVVMKTAESVLNEGAKQFVKEVEKECAICSDYKELTLKMSGLLLNHSQIISAKILSLVLQNLLENHE